MSTNELSNKSNTSSSLGCTLPINSKSQVSIMIIADSIAQQSLAKWLNHDSNWSYFLDSCLVLV